MFADDFVGVSDSKESMQKLIEVVYSYCRANVSKSALMVFSKDAVNGLKWGSIVFQKYLLVNPRRACARVTVLVLSVFFPILAPRAIRRTNSSISDFSAIRA